MKVKHIIAIVKHFNSFISHFLPLRNRTSQDGMATEQAGRVNDEKSRKH